MSANLLAGQNAERKQVGGGVGKSGEKYYSPTVGMLGAFAYCQILVDEKNQPIDYVHLEINDAWERLVGLRKEDVIGKKVTEVIPGIKEFRPDLISIYGKVALTGEEVSLEFYFEPLRKWFTVSAYSPQRGYFVAVFDDITGRKRRQERFIKLGLEALDDGEVIEMLLSTCLPGEQCRALADECIKRFNDLRGFLTAPAGELQQMGISRQCLLNIELMQKIPPKLLKEKMIGRVVSKSPKEIFDYLYYSMRDLKKEIFKVIYLNSRNEIIDTAGLFQGTLESIPIHPREIVESAIKYEAAAMIFAHNHPSGDPTPTKSDKQLTRDLVFIGNIVQIRVLDHIIIGENKYFSFKAEKLIDKYQNDFLNLRMKGITRDIPYRHSN